MSLESIMEREFERMKNASYIYAPLQVEYESIMSIVYCIQNGLHNTVDDVVEKGWPHYYSYDSVVLDRVGIVRNKIWNPEVFASSKPSESYLLREIVSLENNDADRATVQLLLASSPHFLTLFLLAGREDVTLKKLGDSFYVETSDIENEIYIGDMIYTVLKTIIRNPKSIHGKRKSDYVQVAKWGIDSSMLVMQGESYCDVIDKGEKYHRYFLDVPPVIRDEIDEAITKCLGEK